MFLLATSLPVAVAEELPEAAAEVLAAVRAKDAERLAALAQAVEHDPWRVVDDLVVGGHVEAAKAYAKAVGEPYAKPLGRYLAEVPVDDPTARKALLRARQLTDEGRLDHALRLLDGVKPPPRTILAYRIPALRTFLHLELDRRPEAWASNRVAEHAANALGRDLHEEYATVVDAFFELGSGEAPLVALRVAERQAELARYRGWGLRPGLAHLDLGSACLGCYLPDRALGHLVLAADLITHALKHEVDPKQITVARDASAWIKVRSCCAYDLAGESALALQVGERAVRAFQVLKDPLGEAEARWVLGDAHGSAGTLSSALECYRSARVLLESAGDECAEYVLELRVNEGSTLQELGRLEEALPILERAVEVIRSDAKGAIPAVTLMNLGEAQLRAGKPDDALRTFRRALDAVETHPLHEAWCRMLIGDAWTVRGTTSDAQRLAAAEASYRAALALLPEGLEPTLQLYIMTGLGEVRLAQGKAEEALDLARRCADLLGDMTGGLADGEAVAARGHRDRRRAAALGVASARATDEAGLVLEMLERSRAQAFLAALGGRRSARRTILGPEARQRIEAADRRLLQAVRQYRRALATRILKHIRAARMHLDATRAEHHDTTTSVQRDARLRAGAVLSQPASLEELHRALGPGRGAVLYGLLENRSIALVAAEGRAWPVDLPPRAEIEQACAALAAEDRNANRADLEKVLTRLGEMLLGSLDLPASIQHLVVSPDGGLAHLPWPWLADRHFGKAVDVTLVPSATSFLALSISKSGGRARIALGNPDYGRAGTDAANTLYLGGRTPASLPESEAEAKAAAGSDGKLLLGPDATERGLEAALAESGPLEVVHLACHGIVNRAHPERSALALTPDMQDDGFLTALEVSALKIPADLVVLSACESGRDRSARGEGIQGLARAFLLAGARQLVVSMWKVDDKATRLFMQRFYEEWAKPGVGTHEALRRARAVVDRPSDWAAWVVWGTPR